MKENWTYKKLGEVASYINGYAFKPEQWKESGTPIVRIQNLNNSDTAFNYFDGEVPEKVKIDNGDLLISWSASLGAYIWNGGKAFLNQHIFKVVFDKSDIDKMYLKYAVTSKLDAMAEQVHGATMKHIVKKDFDNTRIPYPPLSIQQSIVAELDEINNLLQLKKKELETFDKLAQSIFYEMFGDPVTNEKGWEVKNFGEIGTFLRGKNIQKSDFVKEGMPCIHYGQVHTKFGKMIYSHLTEIPKSVYDKSIIASKGDIIIAITSEDLAGSCKSTAWLGNYDVAVSAHAAVFNHSENPLYIVYYINSSRFKAEKEKYARGFKVMEIKTKDIAKIPITLPPLALQNEFANRIQAIEQQKEQVKASINKLETLLASRMQYWFD